MIDNKTIRKVIMLNKMLPSGSPTYENRESSGAVANFTTNTVQPFVKCECEILPIQEGTGDPSPSNPRPISGTDELTLKHDNENMLSLPTFDFTIQGVRVYTNEDGNVVLNGTSTGGISSDNALWTNNLRFSLPKGHYYLSCNSFSTYGAVVVVKNTDTNATICQFTSNWQIDLTETTPMRIGIYIPADKTFDNFVCNFEASLDNITYDVPNRETYTFDLGQEIMGGTADVVGGTGEDAWAKVAWQDLTVQQYSGHIFQAVVSGIKAPTTLEERRQGILSNNIAVCPTTALNDTMADLSMLHLTDKVYIKIESASTNEEAKTILGDGYLVYELATPESFTFTGQPINSLLGVNNVWTKAGDTKVTYKYKTGEGGSSTKKYLSILYDFYGKGCRHL